MKYIEFGGRSLPLLNPNDKVFYPYQRTNIVVQATITETNEIYDGKLLGIASGSIWAHRFIDSAEDYVSVPTAEMNDDGWPIHERKSISFISEYEPCNQFLWIDEPVGNGIQIGDECFLTLREARNYILPSNAKHLKKRLHNERKSRTNFISSTWGPAGCSDEEIRTNLNWMKKAYPPKSVYVRAR